ncbi:MAG: rod shape-determining protein MreD [Bacilli bacterium]|nr:rod shape-determining protein MreD [Bacilli bacterium]
MRHALIPILLLFLLAFEGVAIELLPAAVKFSDVYLVPQWLLMFLILLTTFSYTKYPIIPIIYGALFGLMTDIVYTSMLGVYMFVLGFTVYIAQLLNRMLQNNLVMMLVIATCCLFVLETSLVMIYSFLGISTMPFGQFIIYRFLPSWIANLIFFLVIYHPTRKLLAWIDVKK